MTCCRCPRLRRINYRINTATWYNSTMERTKKKKMGRGQEVALCQSVSMVDNNAARKALFIGKHKWGLETTSVVFSLRVGFKKSPGCGCVPGWGCPASGTVHWTQWKAGWLPGLCSMFAVLLGATVVHHTAKTVTDTDVPDDSMPPLCASIHICAEMPKNPPQNSTH